MQGAIAANLVLEHEDEDTPARWVKDAFGIYALYPVSYTQIDALIDRALDERRSKE